MKSHVAYASPDRDGISWRGIGNGDSLSESIVSREICVNRGKPRTKCPRIKYSK